MRRQATCARHGCRRLRRSNAATPPDGRAKEFTGTCPHLAKIREHLMATREQHEHQTQLQIAIVLAMVALRPGTRLPRRRFSPMPCRPRSSPRAARRSSRPSATAWPCCREQRSIPRTSASGRTASSSTLRASRCRGRWCCSTAARSRRRCSSRHATSGSSGPKARCSSPATRPRGSPASRRCASAARLPTRSRRPPRPAAPFTSRTAPKVSARPHRRRPPRTRRPRPRTPGTAGPRARRSSSRK